MSIFNGLVLLRLSVHIKPLIREECASRILAWGWPSVFLDAVQLHILGTLSGCSQTCQLVLPVVVQKMKVAPNRMIIYAAFFQGSFWWLTSLRMRFKLFPFFFVEPFPELFLEVRGGKNGGESKWKMGPPATENSVEEESKGRLTGEHQVLQLRHLFLEGRKSFWGARL